MEDIKMIQTIAAISIVVLSIAVIICAKSVYDLNKRINTMQRRYDNILYHNTQLHDITKRMIDMLNKRCDINHKLFEILSKKCEQLEQEMAFRW